MREGAKKHFARQLRSNMSDAEQCLWRRLRQRQIGGCRFRRQLPIGPHIADFVCLERRIIVEIDGGQHSEPVDRERTARLKREGYRLLRFWNNDVLRRTEDVLTQILKELEISSPHPNPPPQAGEGMP